MRQIVVGGYDLAGYFSPETALPELAPRALWHEEALAEVLRKMLDRQVHARSFYEDLAHHDRFILIGMSQQLNLLLVVFAERAGGSIVRIISARRATRRERRAYEERE